MNQYISHRDGYTLVGLNDTAFLISVNNQGSASISELKQGHNALSTSDVEAKGGTYQEDIEENKQKSDEELKAIHAVAVARNDHSILCCAVARGDKSLSIYNLDTQNSHVSELYPAMIYTTPKRLSCITFATWPDSGERDSTKPAPVLLLGGDLAGDAHAYSLETQRQKQRLLLGHTASMLTGLCNYKNILLTSDRDEKIRISSFPQSFVVEGFLLGHAAFVTSVICSQDGLVVTAGGDSTIRMWDLQSQSQLFVLSTTQQGEESSKEARALIPIDLSFNTEETTLSVIYDRCKRLDIFRLVGSRESGQKLELVDSTMCSSQPLGVDGNGAGGFLVLQKDPTYLTCYDTKDGALKESSETFIQELKKIAKERGIVMPDAMLERDQYGQIKLQKIHETRGPASDAEQPWNRVERVGIAKEAVKRHKKRRREAGKS